MHGTAHTPRSRTNTRGLINVTPTTDAELCSWAAADGPPAKDEIACLSRAVLGTDVVEPLEHGGLGVPYDLTDADRARLQEVIDRSFAAGRLRHHFKLLPRDGVLRQGRPQSIQERERQQLAGDAT